MRAPRRPWVANALLLIAASVVVLGAGEAFFRVRESSAGPPPDRLVRDALLGWKLRPDHAFRVRTGEFDVSDRTNSLGLLAPEIAPTKPPGSTRILVLGDSMTEAVQVQRGERSVALIESDLSTRLGRTVEVVNAGVTNYQTDQEVLYYERDGWGLGPDVVLIALFVGNDVMGNATSQRQPGVGPSVKPRFRLVDGALHLEASPLEGDGDPDAFDPHVVDRSAGGLTAILAAMRSALYERSAFYRAAADAAYALRTSMTVPVVPFSWLLFSARPDPEVDEAWALTSALYGRLRESVERNGSRLGVIVIPDPVQVGASRWLEFLRTYRLHEGEWDPDRASRRACALALERGIPCLDLLDTFRVAGDADVFFPQDRHLTVAGHRILADAVIEWLASSGLVR